jgi:hypothetical protein
MTYPERRPKCLQWAGIGLKAGALGSPLPNCPIETVDEEKGQQSCYEPKGERVNRTSHAVAVDVDHAVEHIPHEKD